MYSNYLMSFSQLEDGEVEGGCNQSLGATYIQSIQHRLVGFGDRHIHLKAKGKGPFRHHADV